MRSCVTNKIWKCFLGCTGLTIILILTYANQHIHRVATYIHSKQERFVKTDSKNNTNLKIILLWNKFYEIPMFGLQGSGQEPFITSNCNVNSCYVTANKSELANAAAVVFFLARTKYSLPRERYNDQVYVQVLRESPTYNRINVGDVMNLVMSYRADSDLHFPYLTVKKRSDPATGPYIPLNTFANKTKSIAWLVSNCHTRIKRETYAEELAKYIAVDIIGGCGQLKCPGDDKDLCMENIAKRYKFYLSFENSFCEDYVTEKLWRPLGKEVIPIVLGGTNYTRDAPPHSVINVLDYKSPHHLAEYLHFLSKNESAYVEYFQWKQTYKVYQRESGPAFCELCEMLNERNISKLQEKHVNFDNWWFHHKCKDHIIDSII